MASLPQTIQSPRPDARQPDSLANCGLNPVAPPRAAYIHVPFCRHRCGYCNFTLVAGRDDLIAAYLEALDHELSSLEQPHEVDTLFFGGGTPTHLPPPQLARLFTACGQWFPLAAGGELSVEANPCDLDHPRATVLAEAGVTRVSLGAQSFQPGKLQLLEREHRADDIDRAFGTARQFAQSISLDLIFGVPGESLADWKRDLELALALQPDHVSTYGLTFEKGTNYWSRLARGDLAQLDEDLERQMYELAIDTLTATGFEHYEVSNFARLPQSRPKAPSGPGPASDDDWGNAPSRREGATFRCRHNETYWTGGEYFAAGPGAARFLGGRREMNHRSTTTYIARVLAGQSPVAESECLDPENAARERLVFALRRLEGIDVNQFAAATGFAAEQLGGDSLQQFLNHGLLNLTAGRLKLTRRGLLVSDAIWPAFLRT